MVIKRKACTLSFPPVDANSWPNVIFQYLKHHCWNVGGQNIKSSIFRVVCYQHRMTKAHTAAVLHYVYQRRRTRCSVFVHKIIWWLCVVCVLIIRKFSNLFLKSKINEGDVLFIFGKFWAVHLDPEHNTWTPIPEDLC